MVSLVHAPVHGRFGRIKTLFTLVSYPLYSFTEWNPIVSLPTGVTLPISVLLLHGHPAISPSPCSLYMGPNLLW